MNTTPPDTDVTKAPARPAGAYQPPQLTVLGTLAELTAGNPPPVANDGTFSGSGIH